MQELLLDRLHSLRSVVGLEKYTDDVRIVEIVGLQKRISEWRNVRRVAGRGRACGSL